MMRKVLLLLNVLCASTLLSACASRGPVVYQPPPLTPAEREEIQTKTLNADPDLAYAAIIAVLQDEAWDLQDLAKESGVIQAYTKKRSDSIGPGEDWMREQQPQKGSSKPVAGNRRKERESVLNEWTRWEKLTAHVEPWGSGRTRVRIQIVKFGVQPAVTYSYPVNSMFSRKEITINAPAKEEQVVVEDPLAYTKLFTRIDSAIRVRKEARSK